MIPDLGVWEHPDQIDFDTLPDQSAHTEQSSKPVNTYCDTFDPEWNLQLICQNFGNDPMTPSRPQHLDEMLETSRKLSAGIPFLRVDMYEINGKVYVGEMTFYS